MVINRTWAMPSKWTFTIQPIRELVFKYVGNGIGWADPFSGEYSPAEFTNDLNPERPAKSHIDGLDFIKSISDNSVNGFLYDPPYSFTQAKDAYDNFGKDLFSQDPTKMQYWSECKNEIAKKIISGGILISCGWNTNGVGKNRGFEMIELLIVAHGGSKNDTLVTVERKFISELF